MARPSRAAIVFLIAGPLALAGCDQVQQFNPFSSQSPDDVTGSTSPAGRADTSSTFVEQDVEAPDVFATNDEGLWDGRPSLGGVWVAHPEVADPERVLIKNEANGKTVVGALFRRERDNPGPAIQVSSDAAAELGMLAGQPSTLDVIALRREEVEVPGPIPGPEISEEAIDVASVEGIESSALEAIDAASASEDVISPATTQTIEPATALAPATTLANPAAEAAAVSNLEKPYLQIGIFSVEDNANGSADSLRQIGVVPTVLQQQSSGKTIWRVLVGPATSKGERDQLLSSVKDIGYADAYPVTN